MNQTYNTARAEAQANANETGFDFGLERLGKSWRVFMLPQKRNRYGYELRCEVVMCETLERCKPGHGPL